MSLSVLRANHKWCNSRLQVLGDESFVTADVLLFGYTLFGSYLFTVLLTPCVTLAVCARCPLHALARVDRVRPLKNMYRL